MAEPNQTPPDVAAFLRAQAATQIVADHERVKEFEQAPDDHEVEGAAIRKSA